MPLHTLLLVDPSPKTQAEVRAMFADEPIAVEVAADGQQALEQIEAHRPNVVLACAKAAGVDGYAIAHFVARRANLRSVTVLLLLARSAVDERRVRESGAKGFLTKPLRAPVVVSRIREALVHAPATRPRPAARAKKAAAPKAATRVKAAPRTTVMTPPTVDAPPPEVAPAAVAAPPAVAAPARGEFDAAFDTIDATMRAPLQAGPEDAFMITPAALATIVQEAVDKAIESYQRTHGLTPSHGRDAVGGGPSPDAGRDAVRDTNLDVTRHPHDESAFKRLQHEMGLDDLRLDQADLAPPVQDVAGATAAPVEAPADQRDDLRRLQHEMGLDDLLGPEEPTPAPLDGTPAKPSLADVSLEDAAAAAFRLDRPDESIEWLQEQLHIPGEPDEDAPQPNVWPDAGHAPVVEPVRHALEALRASLSTLVHGRTNHPEPPRPAASTPHEYASEPAAHTMPAARPATAPQPDDIRFTFDPLPPLPPSLLEDRDKD